MADGVSASTKALQGLHKALAEHFVSMLDGGPEKITAADLSVIRQFLRDNGIEATPNNAAISKLKSLSDLPTFDQEKEAS